MLPVSKCPRCDTRIRARDNVPVLGWLLLRGRCRACSLPISGRYPLIEATTGLLFLASYLRFGLTWEAAVSALFASAMVALAMIDAEHFILPDRITLPGIAVGLALQSLVGWTNLRSALVGAAAGAGVILLMNGVWWLLRRVQGFGLGDVKMLAMIGAFLGFSGMVLTLFIGHAGRQPHGARAGRQRADRHAFQATVRFLPGTRIDRRRLSGPGPGLLVRILLPMKSAPRIGFRREVSILVPTSLFVLMVVAVFTVLSYRSAVQLFVAETRSEAAIISRAASVRLAREIGDRDTAQDVDRLRHLAPGALGIAYLGEAGQRLTYIGDLPPGNLLTPAGGIDLPGARAFGPDEVTGERIVVLAPMGPAERRRYLRLDFPDRGLTRQLDNVGILTLLVVVLSSGILVLSILFLRHFLAPFDTLVERARAAVPGSDDAAVDDIPFLLETFDNALSALGGQPEAEFGDIHVLGRALTPSVDCGLLLVSTQGRVLALNSLGSELLGVEGTAQGLDYDSALSTRPEIVGLVAATLAGGEPGAATELEVRLDDRTVTLGIAVHELRRQGREPQGFLFLFADRTAMRHREEQERLSHNLAQMGELTAGIAHEMRNSLTSLRGFLSLAEKRASGAQLQEELEEMRHEADQLKRILEDFLSFARPGSVRMSQVRLESVVRRAASDLSVEGKMKLVSRKLNDDGPRIWGDEQLLERAIRNLLQNALDAQDEAGVEDSPVEVYIAYLDDGARLTVEDRGTGVDPDMRDRLFVPFSTHKPTGVGLGLALTRQIVELHGATLDLEDRDGAGARALIRFPGSSLVRDGAEGPDDQPPTRGSGGNPPDRRL